MILNIFVYKSPLSCPFFYRKPLSADVFINKNRSFNVFCLLFPSDTTREGAKNKQKTVRASIFVYYFVNSSRSRDSRRRPGAENERERPVPLLKKYDFESRALHQSRHACRTAGNRSFIRILAHSSAFSLILRTVNPKKWDKIAQIRIFVPLMAASPGPVPPYGARKWDKKA